MRMLYRSVLLAAIGALAACDYVAIGVPAPIEPGVDPPGRVARLSYVSGQVSFRPAGQDDWVPANLNRPLTAGDELWTDRGSRAELDLGHGFVWLDEETSLGILNLDDDVVQIKITGGTAQVRLRRLDEGDHFEIDTPQAAASLLRTGSFRVTVNAQGSETETITRMGEVEVRTPGQAFSMRTGQRALISGIDNVAYQITPAPGRDSFDDFCATRDQRADRSVSLQYVSPYAIGWEDLDAYGYWMESPPYGPVWYPREVAAGWAPYRFGHWVWIEPWGWTWVDDAPWGFAPFHYGRWVALGARWGWVPGPARIRAVYAPALVVFAGGGPGLHYYFGIGADIGVAWFPLAPYEVYVPPYRASRVYVTNINISHTVIANREGIWKADPARQHYANRRADAFTAVPEEVFEKGRPIGRSAVKVRPDQVASTKVGGSAPPVTPSRPSLAPAGEPGRLTPRPPESIERRGVAVGRPPAPPPVPFEQKSPELERNPGRPPDAAKVDELRRREPQGAPQYRQLPAPAQPQPSPEARRQSPGVPTVRTPAPEAAGTKPAARAPRPPAQTQQPSPSQVENRRRTIDQERKRVETPAKQPRQSGKPPRGPTG